MNGWKNLNFRLDCWTVGFQCDGKCYWFAHLRLINVKKTLAKSVDIESITLFLLLLILVRYSYLHNENEELQNLRQWSSTRNKIRKCLILFEVDLKVPIM